MTLWRSCGPCSLISRAMALVRSGKNPTLERYLEAMAAFLEDSGATYPPNKVGWHDLAQIFIAAKSYE